MRNQKVLKKVNHKSMLSLKIAYKGMVYEDIGQYLYAGLISEVREKLAHLEEELIREGAEITLDLESGDIIIINELSEELKQKIVDAFIK